MKGDIFGMIFLCSLNTYESSEYFKMIFEELGFITVVYMGVYLFGCAHKGPASLVVFETLFFATLG